MISHQSLALAVIQQAMVDLTDTTPRRVPSVDAARRRHRASAWEFLCASTTAARADRAFWCEYLAFDPDYVQRKAITTYDSAVLSAACRDAIFRVGPTPAESPHESLAAATGAVAATTTAP